MGRLIRSLPACLATLAWLALGAWVSLKLCPLMLVSGQPQLILVAFLLPPIWLIVSCRRVQAMSSRTADKFVVRLPDGLRVRIAEVSKQSHRSMNAEIVTRLEKSLADDAASAVKDQTILLLSERIAALEAKECA